jgi:hypothetical protein
MAKAHKPHAASRRGAPKCHKLELDCGVHKIGDTITLALDDVDLASSTQAILANLVEPPGDGAVPHWGSLSHKDTVGNLKTSGLTFTFDEIGVNTFVLVGFDGKNSFKVYRDISCCVAQDM